VDLHRWFGEQYAVPVEAGPDGDEDDTETPT
jgi:hypothetical protein